MQLASRKSLVVAIAMFALAAASSRRANAEPVLDRVLASVHVMNQNSCTALSIEFNLRVRYQSHFPIAFGQELRIQVRAIDIALATAEFLSRRESLRPPETKFGHIRAIYFELDDATGPMLVIQFDRPVTYQVTQGADFQSIIVKLFGKNHPSACKADFPAAGSFGAWSTSVNAAVPAGDQQRPAHATRRGSGTATGEQRRTAAALMDEGRGALRKGDLAIAIAKFTQVLKLPETDSSPEAQELLALAFQRNKQTSQARAEYEDYLTRYKAGDGSDRVRQRLAGLVTATEMSAPILKAPKGGPGARDDGTQTWTVSGSASQFYIRDDSFRTLRDPSLPPDVNADPEAHQTHQNEILTSLDAIATWSGNGVKSKLRFSGTEEHKFGSDGGEIVGIAALFVDTAIRDWGFEARVGRQTRNTGGVLGRFDGAVFSFDATPVFRINAVVGSPVLLRRDEPFKDEKLFYGASLDIAPYNGLDFSIFAIEQRDRSVLDRQAVGAEMRYVDVEKSVFATVDYDIHYQELNAAILNGTWTLADKSTLHAGFDYRKSPYLSAWTAVQGQVYPTLYEMLKNNTLAEIDQLALDRTASFTTASAGFSRPLNATYQVNLDATVTNYSGTPGSAGVSATEGTGNEYFYSAQVIGDSVIRDQDLLIAGLRFADLDQSNYYVMDLSYRYPLMDSLKINPRLMLGYRTGDNSDLVEYTVLPSVLVDYYFTRDWSLELEVGAQWRDTIENGVEETNTELFFTAGYRYDFYADGSIASQSRVAPYGIGVAK